MSTYEKNKIRQKVETIGVRDSEQDARTSNNGKWIVQKQSEQENCSLR